MHVVFFIDDVCVNNLRFADDMGLLNASIDGLGKLLKACENYALGHGLRHNESKSEYVQGAHCKFPKLVSYINTI